MDSSILREMNKGRETDRSVPFTVAAHWCERFELTPSQHEAFNHSAPKIVPIWK